MFFVFPVFHFLCKFIIFNENDHGLFCKYWSPQSQWPEHDIRMTILSLGEGSGCRIIKEFDCRVLRSTLNKNERMRNMFKLIFLLLSVFATMAFFYNCQLCNINLTSEDNCISHLTAQHSISKISLAQFIRYVCTKCGRDYNEKKIFLGKNCLMRTERSNKWSFKEKKCRQID